MSRRKIPSVIVLLFVTVFLGALLVSCQKPSTSEAPLQLAKVRLGVSRLRISLPVFVALEKGFFKEEGVSVDLRPYDTAQPMMDDLVSGKLDMAGYCAYPITFAAQARIGVRLQYLTSLYEDTEHPISILLVNPRRRISSLKDLKGATIGILPTVAYRAWLIQAMRADAVPDNEYKILNIAPTFSATALNSGQIDALFSNDPAATAAKRLTGAVNPFGTSLCVKYLENPFPFGAFNVTEDFARSNHELAKRVAHALDKAIDFIRSHPSEAKASMRAYIPQVFAVDIPNYPDPAYLKVSENTGQQLEPIAEKYIQWGVIERKPDVSTSVYKPN